MRSGVIIFIGIATIALLLFLIKTNTSNNLSTYLSKGDISDLYSDSLSSKIIFNDYQRGERIILDDNREYFFTVKKVLGTPHYSKALRKWVKPGDSIIKSKNSNQFIIKKEGGSTHTVIFFK